MENQSGAQTLSEMQRSEKNPKDTHLRVYDSSQPRAGREVRPRPTAGLRPAPWLPS